MNYDEQPLKLTDLDYLTGDHHLQMMKAALPYMNVPQQRIFSTVIKIRELQRTINLFRDEQVAATGIGSGERDPKDRTGAGPAEMLDAIKPYGNTYEQELIGLLSNLLRGISTPMEQMKTFLSPEQQSRMDTVQFMVQAMQQNS
ncbi:MAG TPA: hypothetical protein IAA09_06600 [Candidatus Lachnoclostridium avicola]|nr:hypothetical protein [Candidatus Lachnoclostridium avicola]